MESSKIYAASAQKIKAHKLLPHTTPKSLIDLTKFLYPAELAGTENPRDKDEELEGRLWEMRMTCGGQANGTEDEDWGCLSPCGHEGRLMQPTSALCSKPRMIVNRGLRLGLRLGLRFSIEASGKVVITPMLIMYVA
jgi:hypothetical protein